ncbi:GNAT family N-acetyltransferase [Pedobacter sp. AW31-3R]|uniref:GNAT family N-acetyltransferase n=1 Tax=Pedobacter sp. AW31-3R TaxID=3445781 RepID=UPI003F9EC0CD
MNNEILKLNSPVYYSLTESHRQFAIDYGGIKFYHPDYTPFGGSYEGARTIQGIDEHALLNDNFYVVGERPDFSSGLRINKELLCNQMLLLDTPQVIDTGNTRLLEEEDLKDLSDLVNLVQPGYFRKETALMGNYYGIYTGNKLVAVAGERMQMDRFTEISGVVTHPDYTGRGYAKQLVARVSSKILADGKIPYLHVLKSNTSAIGLYEKLGFRTRCNISFWHLIRAHQP